MPSDPTMIDTKPDQDAIPGTRSKLAEDIRLRMAARRQRKESGGALGDAIVRRKAERQFERPADPPPPPRHVLPPLDAPAPTDRPALARTKPMSFGFDEEGGGPSVASMMSGSAALRRTPPKHGPPQVSQESVPATELFGEGAMGVGELFKSVGRGAANTAIAAAEGLIREQAQKTFGKHPSEAREIAGRFGEAGRKRVTSVLGEPRGLENTLLGDAATGVGSAGAFLATGPLSLEAGRLAGLGEAVAAIRMAEKQGLIVSEEAAFLRELAGQGIGMTDALPLMAILRPIKRIMPKGVAAALTNRVGGVLGVDMARTSIAGAKKAMAKYPNIQTAVDVIFGATAEGLQEVFQDASSAEMDKLILAMDSSPDLMRAFVGGFGGGAAITGVLAVLARRISGRRAYYAGKNAEMERAIARIQKGFDDAGLTEKVSGKKEKFVPSSTTDKPQQPDLDQQLRRTAQRLAELQSGRPSRRAMAPEPVSRQANQMVFRNEQDAKVWMDDPGLLPPTTAKAIEDGRVEMVASRLLGSDFIVVSLRPTSTAGKTSVVEDAGVHRKDRRQRRAQSTPALAIPSPKDPQPATIDEITEPPETTISELSPGAPTIAQKRLAAPKPMTRQSNQYIFKNEEDAQYWMDDPDLFPDQTARAIKDGRVEAVAVRVVDSNAWSITLRPTSKAGEPSVVPKDTRHRKQRRADRRAAEAAKAAEAAEAAEAAGTAKPAVKAPFEIKPTTKPQPTTIDQPATAAPPTISEPVVAPETTIEETTTSVKEAAPTAEAMTETWLSSLDSEAKGFYERRPNLVAGVRRLAKRIIRKGWSKNSDLTVKDRQGRPETDQTRGDLEKLRDAGAAQIAWDKEGEPHWAAVGLEVPPWLTRSRDDAVMKGLPARPAGEAASDDAGAAPLKIGDELTIMSLPSVLADTKDIGGARWEIFNAAKLSDEQAVTRVTDIDSGKVLGITKYPTYDAAEAYYKAETAKAERMEQPAAAPETDHVKNLRSKLAIVENELEARAGTTKPIKRLLERRNALRKKIEDATKTKVTRVTLPRPFSRAAVERKLLEANNALPTVEESVQHLLEDAHILDDNPFGFSGEVMTEVKEHFEGQPHILKLFKANDPSGMGEETLSALGDSYYHWAEEVAGGKAAGLRRIKHMMESEEGGEAFDPQLAFLAHLHDLILEGDLKPQEVIDPASLKIGDTFEIHGEKFDVLKDDSDKTIIQDGIPGIPVEALDSIPVDKGSLKHDPDGPDDTGGPDDPGGPDDTGGTGQPQGGGPSQLGLMPGTGGGITGSETPGMFGDTRPAPTGDERQPGESDADYKIRRQYGKGEGTGNIFEGEAAATDAATSETPELDALEKAAADRIKNRFTATRDVTTVAADIADIAIIGAVRAVKLGIRGHKAIQDLIKKLADEMGRKFSDADIQKIANRIGTQLEDEQFIAAASDDSARPKDRFDHATRTWGKEFTYTDTLNSVALREAGGSIPSQTQLKTLLNETQRPRVGANRLLLHGTDVEARIDINLFERKGLYAQVITTKGQKASYDSIVRLEGEVSFGGSAKREGYLDEKAGEVLFGAQHKNTFAVVKGKIDQTRSGDGEIRGAAEEPGIDNWIPVGFDPHKATFFYDKRNGKEVLAGTDAISQGNTVFTREITEYGPRTVPEGVSSRENLEKAMGLPSETPELDALEKAAARAAARAPDEVDAAPKVANPYGTPATGRISKAWQHGYEGGGRKVSWARGTAVYEAFIEGKKAAKKGEGQAAPDEADAAPKVANPYGTPATGRVSKAWQHGYEGGGRKVSWARGTAVYKAFIEGKKAAKKGEGQAAAPTSTAKSWSQIADEAAARIKKRHGPQSGATLYGGLFPGGNLILDDTVDAVIWGAAKIVGGVQKFSEFARAAHKQFGNRYKVTTLRAIYRHAKSVAHVPANKLNAKQVIRAVTGQIDTDKEVAYTPRQLLRLSLKMQERGSRAGFRAGQDNVITSHEALVEEAEMVLPKEIRSRVMPAIASARTPGQIRAVQRAIARIAYAYDQREAIKEFKAAKKDAFGTSRESAPRPEFDQRMHALVDPIAESWPTDKVVRRMESMQDHIDNMEAAKAIDPTAEDPDVPLKLIEQAREVLRKRAGRRITELTPDEIRLITATLQNLTHQSRMKSAFLIDGEMRNSAEAVGEARGDMEALHPDKKSDRFVKGEGAIVSLTWNQRFSLDSTAMWLFGENWFGESNSLGAKILFTDMVQGHSDQLAFRYKYDDMLQKAMADAHVTDADLEAWSIPYKFRPTRALTQAGIHTVKVDEATGPGRKPLADGEINMSIGEGMSVYALRQDPNRRTAMNRTGQGITLTRRRDNTPAYLTPRDYHNIEQQLVPPGSKQRKFADAIIGIVNGAMRTEIGKQWLKEHGFPLFAHDHTYWFSMRDPEYLQRDPKQMFRRFQQSMPDMQGMFKPRTGGNIPIRVPDFFESVQTYLLRNAAYMGRSIPVRNARRLLSDTQFRTSVRQRFRYGDQILRNMENAVTELAGLEYAPGSSMDRVVRQLLRNTTKANLALKPQIVLYQTISRITITNELLAFGGWNALRRYGGPIGNMAIPSKAEQREMMRNPTFRERLESRGSQIVTSQQSRTSMQGFWSKKSSEPWTEWTMAGIKYGDLYGIVAAWRVAKKVGDDLRWTRQKTEEFAVHLVNRTQPTWDPTTTSAMAVAGRSNVAAAGITLFQPQPIKNFNIAAQAQIRLLQNPNPTNADYAQLAAGYAIPMVLQSIFLVGIKRFFFFGAASVASIASVGVFSEDDEKDTLMGRALELADRAVGNMEFGLRYPAQILIRHLKNRHKGYRPGGWETDVTPIEGAITQTYEALTGFDKAISTAMSDDPKAWEKFKKFAPRVVMSALRGPASLFGFPGPAIAQWAQPHLKNRNTAYYWRMLRDAISRGEEKRAAHAESRLRKLGASDTAISRKRQYAEETRDGIPHKAPKPSRSRSRTRTRTRERRGR